MSEGADAWVGATSKRATQGANFLVDSTPHIDRSLCDTLSLLPACDEPTEHGLVGNLMYSVLANRVAAQ